MIYVKAATGELVTGETYLTTIKLVRALYLLDVISDEQAMNIVTNFRILFV